MTVLKELRKILALIKWAIVFRVRHPLRFISSYNRIEQSGLFNLSFYDNERRQSARPELDPIVHYLVFGSREGLSPHPLFDDGYYRDTYPAVATSGRNPFVHYLETGAAEGLNPHPLFDTAFYRHQDPEAAASGVNPIAHYLEHGVREGLNPHPLFETAYYISRYPDVEEADMNPLVRFVLDGFRDGRNPHPLFDIVYYTSRRPDLIENRINPLIHFVLGAFREWQNPHPLFDTSYYLSGNDEVRKSGVNPLVHYVTIGWKEGRNPHPLFSNHFYKEQTQLEDKDPLKHYITESIDKLGNPHPLFDNTYYLKQIDLTKGLTGTPLEHFLRSGNCDLKKPHPLFDPSFYLRTNRDVAEERWNPLLHYVLYGCREGRNPHLLFDLSYYSAQWEDGREDNALLHYLQNWAKEDSDPSPVFHTRYYREQLKAAHIHDTNPLIHYLEEGWAAGFNPNPMFFSGYYLKMHPDLRSSSVNPLIHYLEYGGFEGREASPLFDSVTYLRKRPDLIGAKINPLMHYFRHGHSEGAATTPIYSPSIVFAAKDETKNAQKAMKRKESSLSIDGNDVIPVFCVYGPQHVDFIKNMSFFFFERQQTTFGISLHYVNYVSNENLLGSAKRGGIEVHDWSNEKENRQTGFGESLNYLFRKVQPQKAFYIVNPDSYPLSHCLQQMSEAICNGGVGIVEARQWPYEHPKEYDPKTGDTPWASGAFSLVSADIFRLIHGFDELFHLYAEDVDLSWRFWLAGMRVVYQANAVCCHLTGHPGYRRDRYYHEHFWSAVHFIVLSKKYYHDRGEQLAVKILEGSDYPGSFKETVLQEYGRMRASIKCYEGKLHPQIKIWGLNIYHLLKKDAEAMGMYNDTGD